MNLKFHDIYTKPLMIAMMCSGVFASTEIITHGKEESITKKSVKDSIAIFDSIVEKRKAALSTRSKTVDTAKPTDVIGSELNPVEIPILQIGKVQQILKPYSNGTAFRFIYQDEDMWDESIIFFKQNSYLLNKEQYTAFLAAKDGESITVNSKRAVKYAPNKKPAILLSKEVYNILLNSEDGATLKTHLDEYVKHAGYIYTMHEIYEIALGNNDIPDPQSAITNNLATNTPSGITKDIAIGILSKNALNTNKDAIRILFMAHNCSVRDILAVSQSTEDAPRDILGILYKAAFLNDKEALEVLKRLFKGKEQTKHCAVDNETLLSQISDSGNLAIKEFQQVQERFRNDNEQTEYPAIDNETLQSKTSDSGDLSTKQFEELKQCEDILEAAKELFPFASTPERQIAQFELLEFLSFTTKKSISDKPAFSGNKRIIEILVKLASLNDQDAIKQLYHMASSSSRQIIALLKPQDKDLKCINTALDMLQKAAISGSDLAVDTLCKSALLKNQLTIDRIKRVIDTTNRENISKETISKLEKALDTTNKAPVDEEIQIDPVNVFAKFLILLNDN